jgi:uncharacterized membrane protein YphA (DoxX/SURF4 family)
LLGPLRLAVGWGDYPRLLGGLGIVMLVLLRLTIGWHFFSEGYDKFSQNGKWDSRPFFANAKGPFAEHFRQVVWDADGAIRLDVEKTKVHFARYRDAVIRHFGFDAAQKRQAQANYAKAIDQLEYAIDANATDLEEYRLGTDRVARYESDPMRGGVASLKGQTETIRAEWKSKITPVLGQIDSIWRNYEAIQNDAATTQQASRRPPLRMGFPRNQLIDTSVLNQVVPYFDMTIGVCLFLGLFTPLAALAAAGFLGSVFLSQFPPVTGPSSSSYQLIEGMACLVIAGTAAGRFAGLDFIIHTLIQKSWPRAAE